MTPTKSNKINNNAIFFIQSLDQDRQTHLFSRIEHSKSSNKDLSPSTAIHFYSLTKLQVQDLSNMVEQYSGYHKLENFIMHVGHSIIDSGIAETASFLEYA